MNWETVIPLLGVVIGWALKEGSDIVRARVHERAAVGRVLSELFVLHEELGRLKWHHDYFKDRVSSWAEYEKYRRKAANRYIATYGNLDESIRSAKQLVAGSNPLASVDLDTVQAILRWYQTIDLISASKSHESYIKVLSMLEVGYDMAESQLRKAILRLARTHGIVTWLRVRRALAKSAKRSSGEGRKSVEDLLDEAYFDDGTKRNT